MPRRLTLLVISACANALVVATAWAQAVPKVALTRLDCGTPRKTPVTDSDIDFSDILANGKDQTPNIRLVYSCFLIKHGDDYMVWDTGWGMSAGRTRMCLAMAR
jgi:N-acyl homoserine lactone hydrolase